MNTGRTVSLDDEPSRFAIPAPMVLLLIATALVHIPSLFNPFFIDDYVYLETVQNLDGPKLIDIFTTSTMGEEAAGVWWTPEGVLPFYRPIGEMTFALDFAIWGLRPIGYHLTNLLLHLLCIFLVWRLARRLFDEAGWAIVVAVVFALHPIHNEAVGWISGRFDVLVAVCALGATLSFLNARRAGAAWKRWGALSLLWFVVGLGCKETALIMPAVLLVVEVLRVRDVREQGSIGRLVAIGAGFTLIGGLYLMIRFAMFGGLGHLPPPYGVDWSQPVEAVRIVAWNLLQYLIDFVLFIQVDAFFVAPFWLAHPVLLAACAALVILVIGATVWLARSMRALGVGLAWALMFTAPALMAMPGERNVYLASVGMALMAGAGVCALADRLGRRPAAMVWFRRAAAAMILAWVVIAQVEWTVMSVLAGAGEKVFTDIEEALPEPPQNARIYVVNQCPLSAVGFDQALRLRYGRSDIRGCALTLSPTFLAATTDRIVQTGPRSVRLEREGGLFFKSPVEVFHLFSQPIRLFPDGCRRWDLTMLDPPTSIENLTSLHFEFPYDLTDERLQLFVWDNSAIQSRTDYPNLAVSPVLRPFHAPESMTSERLDGSTP